MGSSADDDAGTGCPALVAAAPLTNAPGRAKEGRPILEVAAAVAAGVPAAGLVGAAGSGCVASDAADGTTGVGRVTEGVGVADGTVDPTGFAGVDVCARTGVGACVAAALDCGCVGPFVKMMRRLLGS